jgi:hypothetical protein
MKLLALLTVVALSGCGASDEDQARDAMKQCISWGAKPFTSDYIMCRAMLAHNGYADTQADNAQASGMAIGIAAGMSMNSGSKK